MIMVTYRMKSLFGSYCFRGLESVTIMVGIMATGRQAWCWGIAES